MWKWWCVVGKRNEFVREKDSSRRAELGSPGITSAKLAPTWWCWLSPSSARIASQHSLPPHRWGTSLAIPLFFLLGKPSLSICWLSVTLRLFHGATRQPSPLSVRNPAVWEISCMSSRPPSIDINTFAQHCTTPHRTPSHARRADGRPYGVSDDSASSVLRLPAAGADRSTWSTCPMQEQL